MAFVNYSSANLAQGVLDANLLASGTSLVLKTGQGNLFPTTFPFMGMLESFDSQGRVTKREIVKVTNKIGDVLTIVRSAGYVPADYSATTQTNTAFSFSSGDSFSHTVTSEQVDDIQDELTRIVSEELPLKLDKTEYDLEKSVFGASSTGNDDYAISSADVNSYNNGQTFKIQADVANSGASTLKLNALAPKPLKKLGSGSFADLETGDIIANQIFYATFNSFLNAFQFSVDPATAVVPVISAIEKNFTAGENISARNAVTIKKRTYLANAYDGTANNSVGTTNACGVNFTVNRDCYLKQIRFFDAGGTGSNWAFLKNSGGSILLTLSSKFSAGIHDFSAFNYKLTAGTSYKVEVGTGADSWSTLYRNKTFPTTVGPLTINSSYIGTSTYTNLLYGVYQIDTAEYSVDGNVYNGDSSDRMISGVIGFASETVTSGNQVKVKVGGIVPGFSGLTANSDYFLGSSGAITLSPTSNYVPVGRSISTTEIIFDPTKPHDVVSFNPSVTGSPFTFKNTYGRPISYIVTGGTVSNVQVSRNNGFSYSQIASATNCNTVLSPGDIAIVTYSVLPTITVSML